MNDSKIKVLLVEPEKYPKEIVIDDSLEAMQEVVGGDIEEYMPYDDDVAIICNEEGKMRGLPLNRAVYVQDNDKKEMVDIICGKFFICYAPPESESFQSLPDDMMKKYKEQFKYPERFLRKWAAISWLNLLSRNQRIMRDSRLRTGHPGGDVYS